MDFPSARPMDARMSFLPGALGLVDVTPRMAMFGQLFLQHAANASPASSLADARASVEVVSATVPRTSGPAESAPVFEAAAYLGEWVRSRGLPASWVADGPSEPQLQATDASGSIAYVLPLVSVVRVASTAGYDGLATLLDEVVSDLKRPALACAVCDLRVHPTRDRQLVIDWVDEHLELGVTAAVLARRCRACGRKQETGIHLEDADPFGWMGAASLSATQLALSEFACDCGGPPGEQSRFLLLHDEGEDVGHRLLDVLMTGTHTRLSSWRIKDGLAKPVNE